LAKKFMPDVIQGRHCSVLSKGATPSLRHQKRDLEAELSDAATCDPRRHRLFRGFLAFRARLSMGHPWISAGANAIMTPT
jgi:hypothetical protein